MSRIGFTAWGVSSSALLLVAAGCSGDDDTPTRAEETAPERGCVPGDSAQCDSACPGDVRPTATCEEAGDRVRCACPDAGRAEPAEGAAARAGRAAHDADASGTPDAASPGETSNVAENSSVAETEDAGESAGSTDRAPAPASRWTMMGNGPANGYANPEESTLSADNAGSLREIWRFTVDGFPPGTPAIAEGMVFVLATDGTHAIDLETGAEVWSRPDISGSSSIAYNDEHLYVHAHGEVGQLYRLNAADGTTDWGPVDSYDQMGCEAMSSPILGGGAVIVGHSCSGLELGTVSGDATGRGGVEAFSMDDGSRLWTYWTVPEDGEDGAMVWSSVAIDEDAGRVFASTGNNYTVLGANSDAVHAIDLTDGSPLWKTQIRDNDVWSIPDALGGPETEFGANPILVEAGGKKLVAAGDKASAFWVFDRETGSIEWSKEGLSPSSTSLHGGILMNGASDGSTFYLTANDGEGIQAIVHALDVETGESAWPSKTYPGIAWGAPSLANGVLFVPVDETLYVLDAATGEQLNMFATGGSIAGGSAAIANGKVVVASGLNYPVSSVAKNNDQIVCYGLP